MENIVVYSKIKNLEIPFLVVSSFCIYKLFKYSNSRKVIRNNVDNLYLHKQKHCLSVNKVGKFGTVLSLLKRQQKRIDFVDEFVHKKPGKLKYLEKELEWYDKCWGEKSDARFRNYVTKCYGATSDDTIVLHNFLYYFYHHKKQPFYNLASSDVKLGTRSYELNASSKGDIKYWHKMLEFGTSWKITRKGKKNVFPSKLDYMKWRDESTTTGKYGYRVTYMQRPLASNIMDDDGSPKQSLEHYMYDPVEIQQGNIVYILQCFLDFFQVKDNNSRNMLSGFVNELLILKDVLENSLLFQSYNIIGSSIHFGYDYYKKKYLFLQWIDFSHATELKKHEIKDDGIIDGITSLIELLNKFHFNGERIKNV
jgi:hypothetical protein